MHIRHIPYDASSGLPHSSDAQALILRLERGINFNDLDAVSSAVDSAKHAGAAPDRVKTGELIGISILIKRSLEMTRKLMELPNFDVNCSPDGKRSVLGMALDVKNLPFFEELLGRHGALPSMMPEQYGPPGKAYLYPHFAKLAEKLGIRHQQGRLTPIRQALVDFDEHELHKQLFFSTGKNLDSGNLREIWEQVLQHDKPDGAIAVLALAGPDGVRLLQETLVGVESGRTTLLHKALHFHDAALRQFLKGYYYPSRKKLGGVPNSGLSKFIGTNKTIDCGPISILFAHKRLAQEKSKSEALERSVECISFGVSDFEQANLPSAFKEGVTLDIDSLARLSGDIYFGNVGDWGKISESIFLKMMRAKPWTPGKAERRSCVLGLVSSNHAMAAVQIIKKSASDELTFFQNIHDPNLSVPHVKKRAAVHGAWEWSLTEALGPFNRSDDDPAEIMAFAMPVHAINAMMEGENISAWPRPDQPQVAMLQSRLTHDILLFALKAEQRQAWDRIHAQLRPVASMMDARELAELYQSKDDLPLLAWLASLEKLEAFTMHVDGVCSLPVSDQTKFDILSNFNSGRTVMSMSTAGQTEHILAKIGEMKIPVDKKIKFAVGTPLDEQLPLMDSPGKARAILDFIDGLKELDEEGRCQALEDMQLRDHLSNAVDIEEGDPKLLTELLTALLDMKNVPLEVKLEFLKLEDEHGVNLVIKAWHYEKDDIVEAYLLALSGHESDAGIARLAERVKLARDNDIREPLSSSENSAEQSETDPIGTLIGHIGSLGK